ncbi:MAG: ATP-binding response regulator, partial [Planktothrix sp.]
CELIASSEIRLIFAVKDTGFGIEPEEMNQLFQAFTQTKTGKETQEGTGLGLSITQKFVQLMGGEIQVNSHVGIGTIFTFDIQAQSIENIDLSPEIYPKQQVIGLVPHQPAYKILIVDDKFSNRKLLFQLLQPLGFQLKEAVNGKEAVEIFSGWKPDLIFMDMIMPIMSGSEATQQIKSSSNGNNTVIIAVTATVLEDQKAQVLAMGCDDFITKPFREFHIFEMMKRYLGLEYIYAEPVPKLFKPPNFILTHESFNEMPSAWVDELYQASMDLDYDLVLDLIQEIPSEQGHLSQALTDFVSNYKVDQIFNIIQEIKTNEY